MDIHQEDKLQWMNWLRDLGFQAHLPATLHTSELASRCARCDADQLVAQLRRDGLELPVVVKSEQKNQRSAPTDQSSLPATRVSCTRR